MVVLGALVTALLAFIGELRSRTDRARDKRFGLFLRMRGAHVRVALTQQILRARREADIYHERMRDLLEVLKRRGEAMKANATPTFAEPRAGDVRDSVADISRARELLEYAPIVSFVEGMQRMLGGR